MNKLIVVLFVTLLGTMDIALAANSLTSNVKIKRIDADKSAGDIRIQTDPRPNTSQLGCNSDFWLILKQDNALFAEMYTILLAAKVNDLKVSIGIDDNNSTPQFCNLSRIILE